jgi:hypothetical protein
MFCPATAHPIKGNVAFLRILDPHQVSMMETFKNYIDETENIRFRSRGAWRRSSFSVASS